MPGEVTIALLPGDGIGPEVIHESVKVLQAVASAFELSLTFKEFPIGGAAVDAGGVPLPEATLRGCQQADAILFGAVGGPAWDHLPGPARPEAGLLALRRALGVYANLRPVRVLPPIASVSPLRSEVGAKTDLLIVRELIGGAYFGQPRGRTPEGAVDTIQYAAPEVVRVARTACTLARQRRGKVTSVDKANVLETSRLWRETVTGVAREFPDVTVEHMLVDTCALQLVRAPGQFDVIVTENMFGDILSDEAGGITGSLGLLPSASLGDHPPFLYEPVHGTAPDLAGKDLANPVGAILSAALLLRYSAGRPDAARAIEEAVEGVLADGVRPRDLGGQATTSEVGDRVAHDIRRLPKVPARAGTPPGRRPLKER